SERMHHRDPSTMRAARTAIMAPFAGLRSWNRVTSQPQQEASLGRLHHRENRSEISRRPRGVAEEALPRAELSRRELVEVLRQPDAVPALRESRQAEQREHRLRTDGRKAALR